MIKWFEGGFLQAELLICGTERKVSPPNLPTKDYFVALGTWLGWVRTGNRFESVKLDEIKVRTIPEVIQKLKGATSGGGTEKKEEGKEKGVTERDNDDDDDEEEEEGGGGGGFEGDDDDDEEESQELAANLVKMAIERTIPKSGEEEVAGAGEGGEAKEE